MKYSEKAKKEIGKKLAEGTIDWKHAMEETGMSRSTLRKCKKAYEDSVAHQIDPSMHDDEDEEDSLLHQIRVNATTNRIVEDAEDVVALKDVWKLFLRKKDMVPMYNFANREESYANLGQTLVDLEQLAKGIKGFLQKTEALQKRVIREDFIYDERELVTWFAEAAVTILSDFSVLRDDLFSVLRPATDESCGYGIRPGLARKHLFAHETCEYSQGKTAMVLKSFLIDPAYHSLRAYKLYQRANDLTLEVAEKMKEFFDENYELENHYLWVFDAVTRHKRVGIKGVREYVYLIDYICDRTGIDRKEGVKMGYLCNTDLLEEGTYYILTSELVEEVDDVIAMLKNTDIARRQADEVYYVNTYEADQAKRKEYLYSNATEEKGVLFGDKRNEEKGNDDEFDDEADDDEFEVDDDDEFDDDDDDEFDDDDDDEFDDEDDDEFDDEDDDEFDDEDDEEELWVEEIEEDEDLGVDDVIEIFLEETIVPIDDPFLKKLLNR